MAHLKVGWCVSMTAGLRAGNCVRLHYLYSKYLPTNGHGRSSIEYGLCLTRTGIQPASQQAGTCINANDGIDADSD